MCGGADTAMRSGMVAARKPRGLSAPGALLTIGGALAIDIPALPAIAQPGSALVSSRAQA
jgi:hypothetical protein